MLLDTVVGGLPSAAAALCPEHLKRRWQQRLADKNPFATISDNHDLIRATRLAWIEAAQDVLEAAQARKSDREWHSQYASISAFHDTIRDILLDVREDALDRRKAPGHSPIDVHVEAVIAGVPERISLGEHAAKGASVSAGFTKTLAELSNWSVPEIPPIFQQIADVGLAPHGGGAARSFGELVFAAFAEILKDPRKYPQACEAFHIATEKLGRDLGRATLDAVRGLDDRLDALTSQLDALGILRAGVIHHLELIPKIADDAAATRDGVTSANDKLDKIMRRIAQAEGVPLDALRTILTDMGEAADELDADQIEERLRAKAGEFKALTDRLNRLSNDDPEVRGLRHAAAEALGMGRFAQADTHLAAAEERDLAGLEDLEALAKQKRLSAAESRAGRAAAAKLRTSPDGYREAASHYGEAARIAAPADPGISRDYARRKGMTLIDLGAEFGLNNALLEAVDHFREMTSTVDRTDDPLEWARTQASLGTALMKLGEREGGVERLKEAVVAFRAVLKVRRWDRGPLEWAIAQTNLATTLLRLGERESGTARLKEAVTAFRAVLTVHRRNRVPLRWAMTQTNLGVALSILGEREGEGERGTARLEEAVEAYRAALEEYRQDVVPLRWAMTQANLGTTLMRLGQREGRTTRLQEAVAAFRAALKEQTRERDPVEWARTQTNLGLTLFMLGEREKNTTGMKEALVALNAALEERRQDRAPRDWANTLCLAGDVLRTIADQNHDLILAQLALRQIEDTRQAFHAYGNERERVYHAEQSRAARELVERLRRG
ncbi:tetratricopeptide repeat protein [Pinisolibacter aquiterrae]|nr:tetratricopeptide repeat protein [Pinisolibacter aquiterrae]